MIVNFESNGKTKSLDIPFHASEISFSDFCDFKNFRSQMEDDDQEAETYLMMLPAALETFIPGIRQAGLPSHLERDSGLNLIDFGYTMDIGHELSIMRIYAHVINIIQGYAPLTIPKEFILYKKDYGFTRVKINVDKETETYQVDKQNAVAMMLNLTTGEAIETLEYQRRAAHWMKKTKDIGNIDFELGLTELALLVRKPGELLPADKPGRDKLIKERQELFKNVDLSTVLDLRFFLLATLLDYANSQTLRISGNLPKVTGLKSVRQRRRKGRKLYGRQ